jgi:molecular chaperone HscA
LLKPDERANIDALIEALATQMKSEDPAVIEAATQTLAKGTESFAAQRMNQGIQQALSGKKLEEV